MTRPPDKWDRQQAARDLIDANDGSALGNVTRANVNTVHWKTAERLVQVMPNTYEIFIGPDGGRWIRRQARPRGGELMTAPGTS